MQIEIHLPKPGVALLAIAAVSGWALYFSSGEKTVDATVIEAPSMLAPSSSPRSGERIEGASAPAAGTAAAIEATHTHDERPSPSPFAAQVQSDDEEDDTPRLTQTAMRVKWARAEQEFLREKQDIIRDQLAGLQKERDALGETIDPELEEEFRRSVQLLTSLVKDQQKAEDFLRGAFRQMWNAEEDAMAAATGSPKNDVGIYWPVKATLGISAYFLDPGYKERFKVDHYAIDIPVAQGSDLVAAADGVVKNVVDHGLGYNYITIDHDGFATVYGHISEFAVRPGQRVRAGDRLGKTGGMPGLKGGGSSTGPHLHFGLYVNGVPVDPLKYLPKAQ
ncbi:MAG: M23 family metallopeptidase [Candidatus Peribacteraceae bacterium]|nr:M23 family metallopeptidase [Candidatus Peribacteraceae bacterium]